MTLPNSGALALSQIQSEFGGSNPISLSEYYRGGSLVPSHGNTTGIPSSGQISISQFYGKSDAAPTDSAVSGTCGSTNGGKYATQQSGIQVGNAYGTDYPSHGSWNDSSFTNSSGNVTYNVSRISASISNITNLSFDFEVVGNNSGVGGGNFNGIFGYNVLKVGSTTIANAANGCNYNGSNGTTNYNMSYTGNSISAIPGSGNHTFNFHT